MKAYCICGCWRWCRECCWKRCGIARAGGGGGSPLERLRTVFSGADHPICRFADHPIEEKCKSIENQLLPPKLDLCDSNVVEFTATISRIDRCYFRDHSMLFDFIRNRFLPICNSARRYEFQIWFHSDANSDTNVIASILEMEEIRHCSNVKIEIFDGQKRLPVEEILNWLERSDDGTKNNHQNQKERFLEIYYCCPAFVQNAREMLEHLTKVYLFILWPIITYIFNFNFQIFLITINIYNCCGRNWTNYAVKYKNVFLIY